MKAILKTATPLVALLFLISAAPTSAGEGTRSLVGVITAGSYGQFVATPHSDTSEGYTDFAANIKLFSDGTTKGQFTCSVPEFVTVALTTETWSANADGSITVSGMMYGITADVAEIITDCPTSVVFRAGGPGVGGFDFYFCAFPEGIYDTEVVRNGSRVRISYY